ncbi:seipin-2-like isoform X2 [Tripterygium wilfordii]|uniref:seipin-2-like isoform X2 n=1 Tax=Tripterygium wilfordii TaxID=458696 RepID=UPI0018F81F35|nr:seipin-2-like isoform X2 [Tripterygium wilfordii]
MVMEELFDYEFVDAVDDFPSPDCVGADQLEESTSDSSLSLPEPEKDVSSLEIPSSTPSLRRRSISRRISGEEFGDSNFPDSSSVYSSVTQVLDSKARRYKSHRQLKENEKNLEKSKPTHTPPELEESVDILGDWYDVKEEKEVSTVTTKSDDRFGDSVDSVEQPRESSSSSFLVIVAGLVIKAIAFQINLLINFFTFPFWALYCLFMFMLDPFGALRRGRDYVTGKLKNLLTHIWGIVTRVTSEWLMEHKSMWTLFLRFLWGLLWSIYVGLALFSLLMFSVAISGFLVRNLVEEPVEIKENLNFDYTKNSPVALVPIWSCNAVGCGVNCKENVNVGQSKGTRLIPVNHKLQVIISLTMPESDYNRNLGVFQLLAAYQNPKL